MYQRFIKRLLDTLSATTFAILLIIPFVLIAICIKLDSKGPVLFKQKRAGKDLKPFKVYKFRTMTTNAPKNCPTNSLSDAHNYITRSGKIMRKLSIDELPQILNVLKNEMSIVGPRPVILNETDLLTEREKHSANSCKPGITGWAQVNGRDELRVEEKAKMDGEYAREVGFIMDTRCLIKTITAVLSVKGHKEGHELDNINDNTQQQSAIRSFYAKEED